MMGPAPRRMSLAEFREWDDRTDSRYELIDGEVVAIAPPLRARAIILANLVRVIGGARKSPCIALAGAVVVHSAQADRYVVPELVVTHVPVERSLTPETLERARWSWTASTISG